MKDDQTKKKTLETVGDEPLTLNDRDETREAPAPPDIVIEN